MKKFDILDRNQEILDSHFLEASAGTGKTFAIEHLVVRLLLSGKVALDQIAILTFTRAATRELKERIRLNLLKAHLSLKEEKPSWDYLVPILNQGIEEKKRALELLKEALACYDSAKIFTIHGFCHHLLKEFAFEAKMPFQLSSPDSKGYQSKLQETILDFFRTGIRSPSYCAEQIMGILVKFRQDSKLIEEKVQSWVQQSVSLPDLPNFEEEYLAFCNVLKNLPVIDSKKFIEDFLIQREVFKGMKDSLFLDQAAYLGTLFEKKKIEMNEFAALLAPGDYFLELMEEKNQKARMKKMEPFSLHYPGLFKQLYQDLWPLIERAKKPSNIIARIAKDCQKKWAEESLEFSPDDLLKNMQKALSNPCFLEKIRQRYHAAIVDEFQDTDPIQWKIFQEIFVKGNKMIALVGDPKQSIYAFRKADVYTYLEAANILGKDKKAFLDRNFRSDPLLVKALNAFFSSAEWLMMPKLKQALTFHPVKGKEDKSDHPFNDQKGPLHFFLAEEELKKGKHWPTHALEEQAIFPFLVKEILNLVENEGFHFSDIAVLIKDRYQALRLQTFLKKAFIPSSVKRSKFLKESKAFSSFKELISLMRDPTHLSELKQVLLGPFFQIPYKEAKGGFEQGLLLKARVFFQLLAPSLKEKGLGVFFEEFLQSSWEGPTLLEQIIRLNGLEFFFELRQVCECLMEMKAFFFKSADQLLLEFEKLAERETDEEGSASLLEEQKGVSLMTTHTSKGLEFEIVFTLGAASRHNSYSFEEDCTQEEGYLREKEAEKMRTLYVALTRAKKRVYVPLILEKGSLERDDSDLSPLELFLQKALQDKPLSKEHTLLFLEDFQKKGLASYECIGECPIYIKKASHFKHDDLISPPPLNDIKTGEIFYSFSSLVRNTGQDTSSFSKESFASSLEQLPLGAHTGIILHSIFEKIFKHRLFHPFNENKIAALVEEEVLHTPLEEKREIVLELTKEILHLPLIETGQPFALVDLLPHEVYPEMEFLFSKQHEETLLYFKGFADLIFKKEDHYFVLDWKSNWLGPNAQDYSLEKIKQCMQDHQYDLQASLYASALQRYVKLFDMRPFEEAFGGALYVFLRGKKCYHFFPSLDAYVG